MTASVAQHASQARRRLVDGYQQDGQRVVGLKISLTSPQTQAKVGAERPIWGWLTNAMELADGAVVEDVGTPPRRAEAELVFVLGQDLAGPGITSRDVLAATAAICPGLELPARYGGAGTPAVADLIAANALASKFVLGEPVSHWQHLDLVLLGVVLEVNGEPAHTGCPANVLGHPAQAIAMVVNDMARQDGGELRAGQLIFSGGITPAVTLTPAMTVGANFAHLGRVGFSVAPQPQGPVNR
jgi:2-oxo-3-hexenedioate decarboxylase